MGIFLWSGFSEAAAAADLNVELTYRVHSAQANQLADDYDDGGGMQCTRAFKTGSLYYLAIEYCTWTGQPASQPASRR